MVGRTYLNQLSQNQQLYIPSEGHEGQPISSDFGVGLSAL